MSNRYLLPVAVLLLIAVPLLGSTFPNGGPRSTNNDDTCDIAALPAATLLLPYFEVDTDNLEGETTLFTVTNTGDRAQVVRVTLWTDFGYPVISFNIYLTGYDVQSINLRDVIYTGRIGGEDGTGTSVSHVGELSRGAGSGHDVTECTRIPHLSPAMVTLMVQAFTEGRVVLPNDDSCSVGNAHANAIGYATMDVVSQCSDALPTDDEYFAEDIRYDNVLMGEYQQVNPAGNFAQGGTMVHIRAMPEGGTQATRTAPMFATNFPRTFYRRLLGNEQASDGRQPLPATFMARWINGTGADFRTSLKVWRELVQHDPSACGLSVDEREMTEIVIFDEAENAFTQARAPAGDPPRPEEPAGIPAAALINITDSDFFPRPPNGAPAGWVYLNLDSRSESATTAQQAWVISSLRAEGRYSGDFDATAFGNGCSPRVPKSEIDNPPGAPIGPAQNITP